MIKIDKITIWQKPIGSSSFERWDKTYRNIILYGVKNSPVYRKPTVFELITYSLKEFYFGFFHYCTVGYKVWFKIHSFLYDKCGLYRNWWFYRK